MDIILYNHETAPAPAPTSFQAPSEAETTA
jgi:hypothetical protein